MIDQPESASHIALRDGRLLLDDPMILIDLARGLHRGNVVANFIKDCAYRMTFAAWTDKESGGLERLTAALDQISSTPLTSVELIRLMFGSLREQAATLNWQEGISLAESHGPQHEAFQTLSRDNGAHYATLRALVRLQKHDNATAREGRSANTVANQISRMVTVATINGGFAEGVGFAEEEGWATQGLQDLKEIGLVTTGVAGSHKLSQERPTRWLPTDAGVQVCNQLESLAENYRTWPQATAALLKQLRKRHPVPIPKPQYGAALSVEMTLMVALGHEESRSRMLMDAYLGPRLQSVVQLATWGRTSEGVPGPDSGHHLMGGL